MTDLPAGAVDVELIAVFEIVLPEKSVAFHSDERMIYLPEKESNGSKAFKIAADLASKWGCTYFDTKFRGFVYKTPG